MTSPQPPFLLVDNKYDRINLYPNAVLSSSGDSYGTDMRFVADYRRERTLWTAAAAQTNNFVTTDLGAGGDSAVDTIVLDRGHNLWGKTVRVDGDDGAGGSMVTVLNRALPLKGTIGGDPNVSWCITEEGAAYTFTAPATRRRWITYVTDNWRPNITGIILGARTQLASYSKKLDEDAGGRTVRSEQSVAGYDATDRTYSWRTLDLVLDQIGAAAYDAQIRYLRRVLFERNQPAFIAMNYGTRPERAWLYRLNMPSWSFAAARIARSGTLTFRELYPLVA